jgi:Protein of unknown function (DUF3667)
MSKGSPELIACPACGTPMAALYCPACGEKRVGPGDYKLGHFVDEAFETFAHADGKVFISLRLLLTQPGRLTAEYLKGRRRPYLKPLPLFLVANAIYFLALPLVGWNPLTTPLDTHLHHEWYSPLARAIFEGSFRGGHAPPEYVQAFDAHAALFAKSLVIAMVPLLALATWVFFPRPRRPFLQFGVFALHFYAFFLFYLLASTGITSGILRLLFAQGFHPGDVATDNVISLGGLILLALYLFAASGRVFGGTRALRAAKALALAVIVIEIMHVYRLMLFLITFAIV